LTVGNGKTKVDKDYVLWKKTETRMLNSNVQIVPFKEQYQQEIELLLKSISTEFSEPISTNRITKNLLPPDLYLVAFVENKVVGTISVTRLENDNAVLRKMFLHKNYRGQGIAELLLQNVVNWAIKNNVKAIYLGTMTQFTTAQTFYKKHNFEKISKEMLPKDFPLNPIDSIFFKLHLIQSLQ
jgi:N-acetylglutamate synthase-like GNAT family acetyltransferase